MDQRPNVSLKNSAKQSKFLGLLALVVAFALPFVLVKLFPHKQKINYTTQSQLLLPKNTNHAVDTATTIITSASVVSKAPLSSESDSSQNIKTESSPQKIAQKPSSEAQNTLTTAAASQIAKKSTVATSPKSDWQVVHARSGDTMAAIFSRLGLRSRTLQNIIRATKRGKELANIKPNQQLKFLIKNHVLEKMVLPTPTYNLIIFRQGLSYKTKVKSFKTTSQNRFITATVRGSIFNTAKRQNIPYKLIRQMMEIFTWDINFAKDIKAGDQFTIVYKAFYIKNKLVGTGDIVAVSYRNRGKTFQAVQHRSRTGHIAYFSPSGASLKKAFSRYPLRFSHISSTFRMGRYHPILHYRRAHKGIDLAAPIGTPIRATGDGRIEIIGRQSGYGNMIKIKHNKTYSTIYGHMLRFQRGLSKGSFVTRGQVIGYVGQTGLATGPHCHYEFHINRQPKNPTAVDLPRGDPVPRREIASFKANTTTLLAQLKLFEAGRLANTNHKKAKMG